MNWAECVYKQAQANLLCGMPVNVINLTKKFALTMCIWQLFFKCTNVLGSSHSLYINNYWMIVQMTH